MKSTVRLFFALSQGSEAGNIGISRYNVGVFILFACSVSNASVLGRHGVSPKHIPVSHLANPGMVPEVTIRLGQLWDSKTR